VCHQKVTLPDPVKVYILKPPVTVTVGEPVVDVAAAKVSAYLKITTPDPPAPDAAVPSPATSAPPPPPAAIIRYSTEVGGLGVVLPTKSI
jgi:hypothetical protein